MAELFYHSGFCGPDKNQRKLKTTATMVRSCSLAHPNPEPEPNPHPNQAAFANVDQAARREQAATP